MKIKIMEQKKNPLLKRMDITALIDHEGGPTPSKEEIRKKLSAENNWDLDKIEVKYVHSLFGSALSKSNIKVWDKPLKKLTEGATKLSEEKETKEQKEDVKEKEIGEKKAEKELEVEEEKKTEQDKSLKKGKGGGEGAEVEKSSGKIQKSQKSGTKKDGKKGG